MNSLNNSFSFFQDSCIGYTEFFCVPCSSIGKNKIDEFNKFFTDWFFILKKWQNFTNNVGQGCPRKSPGQLVSLFCISSVPVDEMYLASESFDEPFKNRSLRVVALKLNLINIVWLVFGFIFLNSKAAFSVYKSSQVSEVALCWLNCFFVGFKLKFMGLGNKISKIFRETHSINKQHFLVNIFGKGEINKDFCFITLFYEIWKNQLSKLNSYFLLKRELIKKLVIDELRFFRRAYRSSECFLKPIENVFISRRNNKMNDKFFTVFIYMEAAIAVYVTSCISQISICIHANNIARIGI